MCDGDPFRFWWRGAEVHFLVRRAFWVARRVFRAGSRQFFGRGQVGKRTVEQNGRGGLARRNSAKTAPPRFGIVPVFDGRGASFLDFEQQVHLWMRAAKTGPASRASLLVLHMHSVQRPVCLAEGGDLLGRRDGADYGDSSQLYCSGSGGCHPPAGNEVYALPPFWPVDRWVYRRI